MRGDYILAGVILLIGAVLLALTFGFLDSGGIDYDDDHTLMWDDYRELTDYDNVLGANGSIEVVSIGGAPYIHAAAVGKGQIVYNDGKVANFRVTKATVDLVLMDGQSNAAYYLKNALPPEADQAPAPEAGTCYYFGRLTDPKMNYDFGSISDYAIHDFIDPATGLLRIGDKGPEFCKEYVEATGHKVIWVSLGIIGKRVITWLPPDGSNWVYDADMMQALNTGLSDMPIEIDKTIMLWAQGESDKNANTSISTYKTRFMTFYDAIPAAWGHKIDSCYLISGKTSNMGKINDALAELAAEHDDIKLAVTPELIDTFTVENGLMIWDDLHYSQQGDNAVASAAVRYVLRDMGYSVADPAPIYLMQSVAVTGVGGSIAAPSTVTLYRTDLTQGRAWVTWETMPETDVTGTFTVEGSATVSEALILPYAPAPMLIITVINEFTVDNLTYSVSGTDAAVIGYTGTPGTVTIPTTVSREGVAWNVTSIGAGAFQDCATLTALDLGNVTDIGNSAFYNCTALESVTAAEVVRVGSNGFRGCSALTSIDLPKATILLGYCFNYCTSLETVNAAALESVSGFAFRGCTATTSVTIGPLTGTVSADAFSAWTFYDTDGVTVLTKTAANLANSEFAGTYNKLVKVVS